MAKKRRAKRTTEEQQGFRGMFPFLLRGSIVSIALFFLLLCLMSLLALHSSVPQSALVYMGLICAAIAGFAGGFFAVRKIGKNGLLLGACCTIPACIAACLCVLFVSESVGLMTLLAAMLLIAGGAGGGVLAVNFHR